MDITGRSALVTGGATRVGRSLTLALAAAACSDSGPTKLDHGGIAEAAPMPDARFDHGGIDEAAPMPDARLDHGGIAEAAPMPDARLDNGSSDSAK